MLNVLDIPSRQLRYGSEATEFSEAKAPAANTRVRAGRQHNSWWEIWAPREAHARVATSTVRRRPVVVVAGGCGLGSSARVKGERWGRLQSKRPEH